MADEIVRYDFDAVSADGSDNLTLTLKALINDYPGLEQTPFDEIEFQRLDTTEGFAMFPTQGVSILTERVDVTAHVKQKCAYPFLVVYRTRQSSSNKERIKEWLDNLGRWLERQSVEIDGETYKLSGYPALAEGMEFDKISRTSQCHLYGTTDDKAEDWAISIQAVYYNEFDK